MQQALHSKQLEQHTVAHGQVTEVRQEDMSKLQEENERLRQENGTLTKELNTWRHYAWSQESKLSIAQAETEAQKKKVDALTAQVTSMQQDCLQTVVAQSREMVGALK